MRRRWIRNRPGRRENTVAAMAGMGVGALVAAVIFYLGRLLLAREPLEAPGEIERSLARREEARE